MSSSGSDRSYRSSPERRISSTGSVVAQVKSSIPDKIEVRASCSSNRAILTNSFHRDDENRTVHHNVLIASAKNAIRRNWRSKLPNGSTSTNYCLALIRSSPKRLPGSRPRLNSSTVRSPPCTPASPVSVDPSANHLRNLTWSPSSTTTSRALKARPAYHTYTLRAEDHEHTP